jgi:hypothetical protein
MASLGTADLGKRVVVRYRTGATGPSGGPEMTDVIGHLRAVGKVAVTLERRDGSTIIVSWSDVVACKVVPDQVR